MWLKEGFASWIEYLCVDHCFPEYDVWTQFVYWRLSYALASDALRTSHPIQVPVGHPAEIREIYDGISYSKGASVIRMLHDFIGDEVRALPVPSRPVPPHRSSCLVVHVAFQLVSVTLCCCAELSQRPEPLPDETPVRERGHRAAVGVARVGQRREGV